MNLIPSVSISQWVKRVIWWVLSPKGGLIILLVVLFAAFVAVMFCKTAEGYIGQLLGLSGTEEIKNQILTFLGFSMGGILLALQAVIANIRAKAMENAANAQAKANENAEKGQRQERLKNAIEHLGHDSVSIRLGGAYELFHLAQDTKELRQTVLDILCAHIRQTTGESNYREKYKSKPSEEIQSLLTLLFVQDHGVFRCLRINLQGSWLNGAALTNAHLENAILAEVYLKGAMLIGARLRGAKLAFTKLQKSPLLKAQLQGAELIGTELHGACLNGAQLQGAWLILARLHETSLIGAQLHGVASQDFYTSSFEERVNYYINTETDLSGGIFGGGLVERELEELVEGLPYGEGTELKKMLTPHIGKPKSNELPEKCGAITGSYTKEEAEQWIAEYKEAVPDDLEEDNS